MTANKGARRVLALLAALALAAQPLAAFDTFWHSAATSAAGKQLGLTDDSINITQFGNFSGPDYFGPLFDRVAAPMSGFATNAGLKPAEPKARKTLQDFDTYRRAPSVAHARKYAIFLHFDDLYGELDANWKFDYLFLRLLRNTQVAIKLFYHDSSLSERRRKMLVLMSLGVSLHMVQDFYSHSDWIHHDFPAMGLPLVQLPWGKPRAPTWFEVKAKLGDPEQWPFKVVTGVYPPPPGDAPNTHTHLNHDNSQLFYDGASQIPYHKKGPVPATDENPREHQLFAANTAAGASIEWIEMLEQDPAVKEALDFAKNIKLERLDPMVGQITSALGSTLFLSCAANKWDGNHPPQRRVTECNGIMRSLIATGGGAMAMPPVVGAVGPGSMAPSPGNEFWAMHTQHDLVRKLSLGFGAENGHYLFDANWLKSVNQ